MPARLRSPRTASHLLALATTLAILQSRPPHAAAATLNWTSNDGNWSTPTNWSTNNIPGANDGVGIVGTDGANRTITYDYTGPSLTLSGLSIDLSNAAISGNTALFYMPANNLSANVETVGFTANGTASVIQSGGNNSVSLALTLGNNAGSTGFFTLSDDASLSAATERIGYNGNGSFTQTGGTNTISGFDPLNFGGLCLGCNRSSGTYTLTGNATLTAGAEYLGGIRDDSGSCNGTFIQTGGTNTVVYQLILGSGFQSTASYTLTNGTLIVQPQPPNQQNGGEYIGGCIANFTQTGGTNTIQGNGTLAVGGFGTNGSYTLTGTAALTVSNESIRANGSFSQTGGTNSVVTLTLGGFGDSNAPLGTYSLSGKRHPQCLQRVPQRQFQLFPNRRHKYHHQLAPHGRRPGSPITP